MPKITRPVRPKATPGGRKKTKSKTSPNERSMNRFSGQVKWLDPITGEETLINMNGRRVRAKALGNFVRVGLECCEAIALDKKLTGQDLRVFMFLMSRATLDSQIADSRASIAKLMKTHRQAVGQSVKRLLIAGYLAEFLRVETQKKELYLHPAWLSRSNDFNNSQFQKVMKVANGHHAWEDKRSAVVYLRNRK